MKRSSFGVTYRIGQLYGTGASHASALLHGKYNPRVRPLDFANACEVVAKQLTAESRLLKRRARQIRKAKGGV